MEQFNPFKFAGRIGRLQYFGFGVIWTLIIGVGYLVVFGSLSSASDAEAGLALTTLALAAVAAIATLSYGVRRLHDFDKSGWWYLLACVPFANFVLGLILLFAPGTPGANKYGVR